MKGVLTTREIQISRPTAVVLASSEDEKDGMTDDDMPVVRGSSASDFAHARCVHALRHGIR